MNNMRELTPVERAEPQLTINQEYERTTEPCPSLTYEQQVAGLTDQQILKEYEIRIQFLDKGCVVNVGCKAVAFNSITNAIDAIREYVANPKEVAKHWRKEFNMG